MNEQYKKTLNIFFLVTVFLGHTIIGLMEVDGILNFSSLSFLNSKNQLNKKVKLKIKKNKMKLRKFGVKDSKLDQFDMTPSKAVDGNDNIDLLKKFAVTQNQLEDKINRQDSAIQRDKLKQTREGQRHQRVDFIQQQIMQEARTAKRVENPLLNKVNYNVKFLPPKGITPDEFNELEKVFYSFFKRVAGQYIDNVQRTLLKVVEEKPYLEAKIRNYRPDVLTAMIRYDEEGNAELIRILKSTNDDDIHNIFEKALREMDKIPNVASQVKDEDGKYTTYFQLFINQSARR